ncbi:hypothetical protein NS311_17370 [Pantoea ananatis]|jgi:hypothetical protein|uniref:hypothetical protein n=1 Tax=Pantoea ananas TaxID=553 RepID=UPI00051D1B2E|nr:hypothetical protein KR94_05695 [Pantoea ananatis]KTR54102.1 hypothetical protein NS311_17370 [Pantoea ananatis]KTR69485.1 hypothetical protein NS296_14740 [Pantoea ananatis]MCW1773491.1 hypothetical protein [Pantoea ananatis]MDC7860589.1 hypothetical protein [Pantoea ananatis]
MSWLLAEMYKDYLSERNQRASLVIIKINNTELKQMSKTFITIRGVIVNAMIDEIILTIGRE